MTNIIDRTIIGGLRGLAAQSMTKEQAAALAECARRCRADAVLMTSLASSGHPAGALSSLDIFCTLMAAADITPQNADDDARDRIVVSHGHTSAGVYAALAAFGFFDRDEAVANFRRAGSPYQGHVERAVRGVEWGTGNLGQGLSAGVGFAIAARARGLSSRVFVVMGDGEQPKGQVAEARRLAVKTGLSNITALIDANGIQISGRTDDVLHVDIPALWRADGWEVIDCDGHDFAAIYDALRRADASSQPCVIICRTVMGKGVSFMENIPDYHGKPASGELLERALVELGSSMDEFERLAALRAGALPKGRAAHGPKISLDLGEPKTYTDADKKDGRTAFGAALADVAKANDGKAGRSPVLAFDCDLAGSVKLDIIAKTVPHCMVQCGIQEHTVATTAGAAAAAGAVAVWADFGVFGIDEAYNQQRLNDINHAPIKTVLTHVGLDVGEDGMTHQCIDYVGTMRNLFGYKLVVPADPNQADRATRWMLADGSPVCLAVGRGVHPIITREDGSPFFGGDYKFEYGVVDELRARGRVVIMAMGWLAVSALKARDLLASRGVDAAVLHCATPLALCGEHLGRLLAGRPLVTVEDHNVESGMGSIAAARLMLEGCTVKMRALGATRYGESGKASEVVARMGLSPEAIADAAAELAR